MEYSSLRVETAISLGCAPMFGGINKETIYWQIKDLSILFLITHGFILVPLDGLTELRLGVAGSSMQQLDLPCALLVLNRRII